MKETKSNESVDDLKNEFNLVGCYGQGFFDEGFIVKLNYFFYQVIDNRKTLRHSLTFIFVRRRK